MIEEKTIQAKIYELSDRYNDIDSKRLKESDEIKKNKYFQDMQKIKSMIEALNWVLWGE